MKINYGFGRGNWFESIVVGFIASLLIIVLIPFVLVLAIVIFIAGITGFLKKSIKE